MDERCRAGIGGYYSQNYASVTGGYSPPDSGLDREIPVGKDDLAVAYSCRYEPDYLWRQRQE